MLSNDEARKAIETILKAEGIDGRVEHESNEHTSYFSIITENGIEFEMGWFGEWKEVQSIVGTAQVKLYEFYLCDDYHEDNIVQDVNFYQGLVSFFTELHRMKLQSALELL